MAGFQIPGLGQAKPNELLPPLPSDVLVAAASAEGFEEVQTPTSTLERTTAEAQPPVLADQSTTEAQPIDSDSMVIDRPASPPSLTGALEAALGGLDQDTTQEAPSNRPQADLQNDQGENPEWEVDSSPYVSSTESSSSDSSSDEDSDNEGYELLGVEETARLLLQAEGGSDDEGEKSGKGTTAAQVRTKNEITEEVIPKPDVTITQEMKIEELGSIEHIVENIALVKAITPGEYQVLDTGSVLCTAERGVIGVVSETIGKVLQPLYTVRFSSEEEIRELGLEVGTKIFYPVEHASYVFTQPLKNLKGSDASNLHDEEVGDDEMEFSDDEKEAEYKRSLKQKKKDKWNKPGGRGGKDPHPLRQEARPDGGLNYDDDDGPYKPLARPPGYGDGPVTNETYEPPSSRNIQRGGRHGDSRGRGGRGRGGRGGRGRGGFDQLRDGYSLPPQGHHQQQPQQPLAPPAQWGTAPAPPQASAPAMPNFGFQLPGWPQPAGGAAAPPPPPPGWPAQAQGQAPNGGGFVNPAFFAALMSQMQAQNPQPQWPQQPPPNGGQGR